METFNFFGLRNFIFGKPQERYHELVRIFQAILVYQDCVISYEVRKHPIILSLEDFAQACNLSFIQEDYDQKDFKDNEFNFDPSSGIPSSFNVGLIRSDNRMIHHIMNHIIFPRKNNFCTIQKLYIPAICLLENQFRRIG